MRGCLPIRSGARSSTPTWRRAATRPPSLHEAIRYRKAQLAHGPKLVEHHPDGEKWRGFAAAKELNEYIVEQAWFAPFYRVLGVIVTNDATTVTMKDGQAVSNLWDIVPA